MVLDDVGVSVSTSVDVGVGVIAPASVGVGVLVDSEVGVSASVGVDVDELLKVTLGLWLFVSVTVNELVVSCMINVSVPAF